MKSRAQVKSHPIHPMLVVFPIAFLSGSFFFDIFSFITLKEQYSIVAFWLQVSGVGAGLLAAIPGLIDYNFTVPPDSSASKRGMKHGLLNSLALVLFLSCWFYRRTTDPSLWIMLLLEAAGFVCLCFAGWLGGTLVYRNQIGVDPRYAEAGKWKEASLMEEKTVEVPDIAELKENQMKLLRIGDKRIVLAKTSDGYVAFADRCSHRGGSLAGGAMICKTVQCPWHGSQFDVSNGEVKAGPAKEKIQTFPVTVEDGKVFLRLS